MNCHTQAANFSLGLEHSQLNRDFLYVDSGVVANQLYTANFIGMFSAPLADDVENLPKLFDLAGSAPTAGELADAGRSYLHSNCSGCHRPLGPAPSDMDLRFATTLFNTNTCNVEPTSGDLGVANAKLISPGNAGESIIPNRMGRRDVHGMPPLGSNIADSNGVSLVTNWIDSLVGCP
jgi:hypothetical protein